MYNNWFKGYTFKKQCGVINLNNITKLNKTTIIISVLSSYLGEDFEEIKNIIKKKENRYLLLLLLKNYKCLNREEIKLMFNISSEKSVNYNIKKAEEKFLINRDFREIYFKIEKYLEQII